ncbi:MAG TPA: sigma-70 family RNA polymerase sigma factor [Bacteroidia bacterium]|jgi:RNA polymerase sigma factor (sigma-70 family)|nr:sigma-70 family RNA polymerase sigma factor [Bacteroidia bacterium]
MSIQHLDDNRLVNLYVKGNEEALAILIKRHKQKVYSCIYLLVRNRTLTEDFFQDTFVKVIQSLKSGNYYEDGKFGAWLQRIARNLVIDYFRKNKKMQTVPNVVNEDGEEVDIFSILKIESDDRTAEEKMFIKKTMRSLIEELPYEQKEVVIMRAYYDMSFKEISDMTSVSINTALGRMRYSLINLKKMMEERQIEIAL